MRDLDQLEERDPDERGRQLGVLVMAFGVIAVLIVAVGAMLGKAAERHTERRADPLDQLERVLSPTTSATVRVPSGPNPDATEPPVDPTSLTFERELTGQEDRPEVLQALAAAAREERSLAPDVQGATAKSAVDVAPPMPAHTRQGQAARRITAAATETSRAPAADPALAVDTGMRTLDVSAQQLPSAAASIPAGMAASEASEKLVKSAGHDRLIAAALPKREPVPQAPPGSDGKFTLQVISYDTRAAAEAFAKGLRAKGHEAFVEAGDVKGRGRYYRVRIGPFKTKGEAEAYRRSFEQREAMNTIVVKRREPRR